MSAYSVKAKAGTEYWRDVREKNDQQHDTGNNEHLNEEIKRKQNHIDLTGLRTEAKFPSFANMMTTDAVDHSLPLNRDVSVFINTKLMV